MFPVEIWEEILNHGEAKDLVRFRRVSKTWNAICEKILESNDIWHRQCRKDIPAKFWSALQERANLPNIDDEQSHKKGMESQYWYQIYKSWKEWHKIVEKRPSIRTIKPLPHYRTSERITCISALGNIIAVGSTEGYITFYDTILKDVFYRADHAESLENVQLFAKDTYVFACSLSINDRIKFWNLQSKHEEVDLRSRGSIISADRGNCFTINDDLMRTYYLCRRDSVNHRLRVPNNIYIKKDVRKLWLLEGKIVAAGAKYDELELYTSTHSLTQSIIVGKCGPRSNSRTLKPDIQVRYYRIFKGHVVACIGVYGEVGFSIDAGEWKIYNLFENFGAPVTTVLFHIAFLALGLQSGEVYLFEVPDVKDLENFDFKNRKFRKLLLDTEAIISLNVIEYESEQCIIAASSRNVHFVRLK